MPADPESTWEVNVALLLEDLMQHIRAHCSGDFRTNADLDVVFASIGGPPPVEEGE